MQSTFRSFTSALAIPVLLITSLPGRPAAAEALAAQSARGQQAPLDLPAISFELVTAGLTEPVFVTNAGDASGRLFIVEQGGTIRIFKDGALLPTPFLNISGLLPAPRGGEQGLLSLAFHPNYETNKLFYVLYNDTSGDLKLARYQTSSNPDVANSSGTVLLTIAHPGHANHNGGTLAFGPDGYLYWSTGDGGGGGDPDENAQDLTKLLGKILRLDVDAAAPYIPASNPFVGIAGRDEIWAYGLRNPWRTGFDRLTGDLFIGDVGQNTYEEVDFQPAGSTGGENYGWDMYEANSEYNPPFEGPYVPAGKTFPVANYDHGFGCSITGGYVYRGSQFPELEGTYLYADFCSGQMWGLVHNLDDTWTSSPIASTGFNISSFGQDEQGELYVVDYNGAFYHIAPPPWMISGTVRVGGARLDYTDGTPKFVTSAANGSYSLAVSRDWTGTVTPSKAGCVFSPSFNTYGPVTADISGEDYDATCTFTYKSVGTQDGWVLESSETSGVGGSMDAGSTQFNLGDDAANRQYRAILSFNTAALPDSAIITGATLQIRKTGAAGANPFASLGNIVVDIKQGGFSNVAALQKSDFSAMGTKHYVMQFTNNPVNNWYSRTFPAGALGYINLTGGTQFRLRFGTDDNNNLMADLLKFASGNITTADRPQLTISFHAP